MLCDLNCDAEGVCMIRILSTNTTGRITMQRNYICKTKNMEYIMETTFELLWLFYSRRQSMKIIRCYLFEILQLF